MAYLLEYSKSPVEKLWTRKSHLCLWAPKTTCKFNSLLEEFTELNKAGILVFIVIEADRSRLKSDPKNESLLLLLY